MQGGLLASVIANQKDSSATSSTTIFLVTKFIIHVIFGALLGLLGSSISLSLSTRLFFQGFAAVFMFASAMNLLDAHPIFRYLAFQPPKFARGLIKNNSKVGTLFAPALLGFLTILIPCGVTQAMEVLAIGSGSALNGALIMGTFILGTSPMFVLIGFAASRVSDNSKKYFTYTAAALLIGMALYSFNGILQVLDSGYSLQRLGPKIVHLLPPYEKSSPSILKDPNVIVESGVQKVTISVSNGGYSPTSFKVKKDVPVELTLAADTGVYSCATAFTFREFKIVDYLKPGDSNVHTFTPTEKGIFTFACSMGMYSGTMEVI
jgi:sulfite exporter TauE/SafE